LVGAGGYAVRHREALEILQAEGRVLLVAAADPGFAASHELAAPFTERGVHCYLSDEAMIAEEGGLDAVIIATPIPLHFAMVKRGLARGLKILLEKPPVPLLSQLDALLALPGSDGVAVGFQHICSPPVRRMQELIESGALGALREIRAGACWPRLDDYYLRARWAGRLLLDGEPVWDGPATNALAHVIHNAMFFAAAPGERFSVPASVRGEFHHARPIEASDTVALRARFAGGPVFTAAFTHATKESLPFRIRVLGTAGSAEILDDGKSLAVNGEPVSCETAELPIITLQRDFLDFCTGCIPRPATSLADTRGFLTLTNGALEAAGAIRTIPAPFAARHEARGLTGYEVSGIADLVVRTLDDGELFSEAGAPWAASSAETGVASLRGLDLQAVAGR
jgi:predicted dehydrogenase